MSNSIEQQELSEIEIKKLQTYTIYDRQQDKTVDCIVVDVTQHYICVLDEEGYISEFNKEGFNETSNMLVLEDKPTPKFKAVGIDAVGEIEPFTVVQLKGGDPAIIILVDKNEDYCYKGVTINPSVMEASWSEEGSNYIGLVTPQDIEYVLINRNKFN